MRNQGPYLPDIWTEPFIPAIPVQMADEVKRQLDTSAYPGCKYIHIKDYPEPGQTWLEILLVSLCDEFRSEQYVSDIMDRLQDASNSSFSPPMRRARAFKDLLAYLSGNQKLVLYISRPISNLRENDFEHLAHYIGKGIGIICLVSGSNSVPESFKPDISYYAMKNRVNEGAPVYFSYSRKDSTKLVETICTALDSKNIEYSLDMINPGLQDSIKEYEHKIGMSEHIIVVISDDYFESDDCMYEMAIITKHGNIRKRVVFVDNLGVVRRSIESRKIILERWEKEYERYQNALDPSDVEGTKLLQYLKAIIDEFPEFWSHVVDDIAMSASVIKQDSAYILVEHMIDKVTPLPKPELEPLPDDPINTGNTPTQIVNINQSGVGSAVIVNNNGLIKIG